MTDFDDVPLHIGMTTDPGCSFPAPPFNAYQARAASDMRNDLLTAASLARDEHTARLRLLRLCAHPSFAAVALENDGRTIALPLAQNLCHGSIGLAVGGEAADRKGIAVFDVLCNGIVQCHDLIQDKTLPDFDERVLWPMSILHGFLQKSADWCSYRLQFRL